MSKRDGEMDHMFVPCQWLTSFLTASFPSIESWFHPHLRHLLSPRLHHLGQQLRRPTHCFLSCHHWTHSHPLRLHCHCRCPFPIRLLRLAYPQSLRNHLQGSKLEGMISFYCSSLHNIGVLSSSHSMVDCSYWIGSVSCYNMNRNFTHWLDILRTWPPHPTCILQASIWNLLTFQRHLLSVWFNGPLLEVLSAPFATTGFL